ncbi:hypothetical protein B7486_45695 [cyanobacterium TDX16]|nr:hypothetical protein B7486_45695 [cyanobacterium TDX16]
MSNLVVTTYSDGSLVVDSRLIAQELGITHKALMETIRNYQPLIEQQFGTVRFETEGSNGLPGYAVFCYLTEDQASFVGTLSRNTDQVVAFKAHLVKAFSEAKQQSIPKSPYELISMLASVGAEMEKRVNAVEFKLQEIEATRRRV